MSIEAECLEEEITDSVNRIRRESAAHGGHPPDDLEDRVRALIVSQRTDKMLREMKEAFSLSPYAPADETLRVIERIKKESNGRQEQIERLKEESERTSLVKPSVSN